MESRRRTEDHRGTTGGLDRGTQMKTASLEFSGSVIATLMMSTYRNVLNVFNVLKKVCWVDVKK